MTTAEHGFPRYYKVGSAETRDPTELKSLVNSARGLTADRYDTFEAPRGTDYVVPAGKTLYITKLQGNGNIPTANIIVVWVGYGDDGVADSVTAPTNSKTLSQIQAMQGNGYMMDLDVWLPIPAGKYPWVSFNQATWNFQAYGIEV